jgi:hypothetical protein
MNIEPTLRHLLTRPAPFICLVKGQWGVGKTYFIKQFIRENHPVIAKQNYAYVSLFGISGPDELIQAIYLNTIPTKTLAQPLADVFSRASSDDALDRVKLFVGRAKPLVSRLAGIPLFGANNLRAFVVSNAAHWFTRNTLIVVDDLERHGSSFSIRDILGILTDLKEERGCQIIIVMNEDALQKDGGDKPYFETKEKVIDRELTFEPTIEDAVAIGLTEKAKNQLAAECCLKLQIGNIRTIQKIDGALRQLRETLAELQMTIPESFDQQIQTTTVLAAWAYWERIIDIDDLEKMEPGDSTIALMEEAQARYTDKQKDLFQRVRDYGYAFSDDTDKLLIRFIRTGAIDKEELRLRVQENDATVLKHQRNAAMEQAWEVYRGTLRPNVEEVVNALYEAHVAGIEDAQFGSVGPAVWVLRELGAEDKADDLTARFFHRTNPIDSFSSYPFKEMIRDEKFLETWKETTEREIPDERSLDETINSYYFDKGRAMEDFKRLSQFSEEEFYEWFRTTTNPKVLSVASALSRIQYRLPQATAEIEKIERDVQAALRRISGENKISQVRLRSLFPENPPAGFGRDEADAVPPDEC